MFRKFVIVGIILGMIAGFGMGLCRQAVAGLTTDQIMHQVWNQDNDTLNVTASDVIDVTFYPVTEHTYSAGAGVTKTATTAYASMLLDTCANFGLPRADLWSVDINGKLEVDGGVGTGNMYFWIVAGNGISDVAYNNIMAEEDVAITTANDVLKFTSSEGAADIDVPDGSYTMAEYAAALAVAMNADDTLTGTGTITFVVDYNVTAESKFTIDAGVGNTIAFTFTTSDGATVVGMLADIGAAQTIESSVGVPNQTETSVPNTATAKSVDANRCGSFPSFWNEAPFSIKIYAAAVETDATAKALDTTAVIVKAVTK